MIKIIFNKSENRAIAYDNNIEIGECVFVETKDCWNIVHTEVDKLYQGQGIALKLVQNIIQNAKKFDKRIIAECSYARKVLEQKKSI